ncbi:S-layer homology domain-containing protein, partial [Paenibacillus mendelii]
HAAAPVIVTEPQDQTANEGAAATLSVTANISGSGTLTYQWYRNTSNSTNGAAPIFGATGASYTVPTAAVGDLYYYAIVTNTDATATGNQTATATSSVAKVTVEALPPAITSTVVSAAPDPSIWGTTVTLTAAVTAISATPSGTVSFYDGNTLLDTATLSGSTAVMTTSVLSIGTHTITATYNGNANFVGSTGTTTVTVQAVPTYTIAAIANQVASSLIQGYATSSIETKTIQVTNNGTGNLTNVSVTLSGANANQFIITQPAVTVNTGDSTSFTVRAKDGLTAGTYAATVTVSASNMTDVSFSVTQTVNAPTPVYPVIGTASPGSASTDVEVLVNGKAEKAGTASTSTVNNQTVTKVAVDQNKLENKLAEEGQGAIVTIQVKASSDVVIVGLNGQMVQNMESKQAILEFKTNHATYTLPVQHIDWESLSEELGKSVDLQDISVEIEIAKPKAETVQAIEDAAEQGGFTIVAPPLNFTVTVKYGDKTIQLSTFDAYVKRMIAIPDGVDANKLTTGVVLEPDGTVRHVPTMVSNIDGTYYAQISSLINSTYAVIWNPVEFRDMANHWANDAVNDMGSRLIVTGTVTGRYHPDRDISRAEFAAIAVRALGLKLENGASPFSDVKDSDWYSSAINTAYAYKLISGYEDGTFRPAEKITREQAMVIIAKAMKITKLNDKLSADQIEAALRSLTDAEDASNWARSGIADCIGAGIVSGRNGIELAPQASITRAEVAVIVERLLTKSGLI